MNEIQLKICDIQGRLFELSAEKKYDSINFIKAYAEFALIHVIHMTAITVILFIFH